MANETEDERTKRRDKRNKAKAEKHENASQEEIKVLREQEALRKQLEREKQVPISQFAARNAKQVLAGEQMVPELFNTDDSIMKMDNICKYCKARKWGKETASICCNKGKGH